MKIKVINIFCDKFTGEVYNPGTILDFEDEARVKDLSDRKLAEVIEEKKASKGIVLFEQEFEKKDVVEALKSIGRIFYPVLRQECQYLYQKHKSKSRPLLGDDIRNKSPHCG